MLIKNIKQGTIWEVEGDLKNRLLANPDYKEHVPVKKKKVIKVVKEEVKEEIKETIDYEKEAKKYHKGGGNYDIPGIEGNVRGKANAIKALKG